MKTDRGGAPRSATSATARAINDRLALDLLLHRGALTAPQLRTFTGLSRPTVSDLLARLQEAGLVAMTGESDAVRRGPNARLYELVAGRAHVAGVDVRKESVSMVVADLTGAVLTSTDLPVVNAAGGPVGAAVEALVDAVRRTGNQAPHTLAVGAPGLVDPATGELRSTKGLPTWHADLVAALRRRLGIPVLLENEVNLAALAELRQGAARDRDTFVLLWLGQSVGAGTVLDGLLRRGASGGAGEMGYLPVPAAGPPPETIWGNCYHDVVNSAAVCDLARRHGIETPAGWDEVAAEAAVRAALAAGQRGTLFLDELATSIALGALAICVVLDPGCLVLGGEIGRAGGRELAGRVAARLAGRSPGPTEVRAAEVPGSAVLAGAVLTALDAAHADLFGPPVSVTPYRPG